MRSIRRFEASDARVWQAVAEQVGGRFKPESLFDNPKIQVRVDAWILTLDVAFPERPERFTRLRAPYVNPEGFRFHVYREAACGDLSTLLGGQDVRVGEPSFDAAFVVKANDEARIRELLTPALRDQLLAHPRFSLQVKDDEGWFGANFPEGVDELYMSLPKLVVDETELMAAFRLFAATLRRLCEMGVAYSQPANVRL